ncbi:MAG: LLM class flavin-dependent oxidoreductase [Deltaproteobacteria bacterium]|nr:LLM class flavin-dependent oxidoreductase [Deltaproteobacteria bacterium]
MRLSILDLSPVPSGKSPAEALASTIDLARHAEALGLERYWLAEHHNAASMASSSPEILIASIAMVTKTLRVGSGGIMLPNHSPLKVAEIFRVLHALHPGRIDLGIGRAPGTDAKTALALRRVRELVTNDTFPEQLVELLRYLTHDPDPTVPFGEVKAVPTRVPPPALFLLGSGMASGGLAAEHGAGFAFAHHFSPGEAAASMLRYRETFRPSAQRAAPYAILAVAAICGETDAHAEALASSGELSWLRFGRGLRDLPLPSVEEAAAHERHPDDEPYRAMQRDKLICGEPTRVADRLRALAEETKADEVMVTSTVHDHDERKRVYDRLRRALG